MRFNYKILFLLFFFPINLFAQPADITGLWKGQIYVDSTKMYLPYEIAISEEKGKLTGYSRIIFFEKGKEEAGYQQISIKWKGNDVYIEDEGFFEHNFSFNPPKQIKKLMILTFSQVDTEMVMKGTWSTNRTKRFLSATGTAELRRKTDFKQTALYKKLDTLKLAPKLTFTYTEKKTEPVLTVSADPDRKREEPVKPAPIKEEPVVEVDAPILPSIDKIQNLSVLPVIKKRQSPIADVEPPKKEKIALYAAVTKWRFTYKPIIESAPEEKTSSIAVAETAPQKKTEPVSKPTPPPVDTAVRPVPKPIPPPITIIAPSVSQGAAELEKRSTKLEKVNYYFETDSLVLTLYDNGYVDGDTVTVVMNGNIIFSKQMLTEKANSKTIYIPKDLDSVKLIMYAESLGEIPPNTGLLIVMDGEKRFEVRFSADLKTNAAIMLRRKRE